jgi:uncharacterized damage-inducible protein DinB
METIFTLLHTAEAEEVILGVLQTVETQEAWERELATKLAEVQAEAEDVVITIPTESAAEAAEQIAQDKMVKTQQFKTELEVAVTLEDLVTDQVHHLAHLELHTAGLHGLALVEQAE